MSNPRVQLAATAFALTGAALVPSHALAAEAGTTTGCFFGNVQAFLLEVAAGTPCHGFRVIDVAVLGVVALLLVAAMRFRHALARRRLDLARRMVDQGLEPPGDLMGTAHRDDLRRGVILIFLGVGLTLASLLGAHGRASPFGLVPGFVGLGYLLSHLLAARRPKP